MKITDHFKFIKKSQPISTNNVIQISQKNDEKKLYQDTQKSESIIKSSIQVIQLQNSQEVQKIQQLNETNEKPRKRLKKLNDNEMQNEKVEKKFKKIEQMEIEPQQKKEFVPQLEKDIILPNLNNDEFFSKFKYVDSKNNQTIDDMMLKTKNQIKKPKPQQVEKIDIEFSDESKANTEVLEEIYDNSELDDDLLEELNKVDFSNQKKNQMKQQEAAQKYTQKQEQTRMLEEIKIQEQTLEQIQISAKIKQQNHKQEGNKMKEQIKIKDQPVVNIKQDESIQKPKGKSAKKETQISMEIFGNLTFVITGVLQQTSRDDATDIIKSLGGRVTSAVSGKTSYLISGSILEDGREVTEGSKYKKAGQLKVPIITEDQFDQLLFEKTGQHLIECQQSLKSGETIGQKRDEVQQEPKKIKIEPYQQTSRFSEFQQLQQNVKEQKNNQQMEIIQSQNRTQETTLWTTKYKPKCMNDLVGNFSVITSIKQWLHDWDDVVIKGNKKQTIWKGNNTENLNARACLISGPPGIGKTSFVRLLAQEMNYELIQTNASDIRNKSSIDNMFKHLTNNNLLKVGQNHHIKKDKKFFILLDEVDGMSGNNDRGGNKALIDIIKTTQTPIFAICNDRMDPKIRSLATYCLDKKFQKQII